LSGARALWLWLDEPFTRLEMRRLRRLFSRPLFLIEAVAGLLLAPVGMGKLLTYARSAGGRSPLEICSWPVAAFLVVLGLGLPAIAYLHGSQIWRTEREQGTLPHLLVTRQRPAGLILSSWAASLYLCGCLAIAPVLVGTVVAVGTRAVWWQWPAGLGLATLATMAGAALGVASSFLTGQFLSRWQIRLGGAALLAVGVGVWARVETVAHGWTGPWEDHLNYALTAAYLLTPAPYLFGLGAPEWWRISTTPAAGVAVSAEVGAAAAAGALLLITLGGLALAIRGLRRLRANPELLAPRRREETREAGEEYYWRGFANPVWTRDLRTRLRSRETARFIYVVSIVVAAGGFLPLLTTAADLSDPLATADVARQVFAWLAMTLIALVTLLCPGMTAEAIARERVGHSLDLLLSTPLTPREILGGKLLGSLSVLVLFITPSLPLFGLCMMFHGAEASQVLLLYAVLIVTLLITGLIGITASAIHLRAQYAKLQAYGVSLLAVALPGSLGWIAYVIAVPAVGASPSTPIVAWSALQMFFIGFVLLLMWGNAAERLEYAEY